MEQRTEEWFAEKRGKVSASVAVGICKGRSGYTAARKNLMAQLICEILTNTTEPTFQSADMLWGIENEPLACTAYELKTGLRIRHEGFINHPSIAMFGCSPDALIDEDPEGEGGGEIKCPKTATHLETILTGKIKRDYIYQIQTCLMCTGRSWWDFISYDPRLPSPKDLYIKRFYPDKTIIAEITEEVLSFNAEKELKLAAVRAYEG